MSLHTIKAAAIEPAMLCAAVRTGLKLRPDRMAALHTLFAPAVDFISAIAVHFSSVTSTRVQKFYLETYDKLIPRPRFCPLKGMSVEC